MGIINFVRKQLENNVDNPKGIEYIIRVFSCLPKGTMKKTGFGIFNTLINKLNNVMPELHLPGYNFCGPFTKLNERLERVDEPIKTLDAGCKEHDIFTVIIKILKKDILLIKNWKI
jgi:hypothetical protein